MAAKKSSKTNRSKGASKNRSSTKRKTSLSLGSGVMKSMDDATSPKKKGSRKIRLTPKKTLGLIVLIAALAGLLYYFKGFFVVAVVNGTPITQLELISDLEKTYGSQEVDNLVTKKLIMQEARKQNITVTDKDVQDQLDTLDKTFKDQGSSMDQYLSYSGITMDQMKENIRLRSMLEQILKDKVSVSDDEIKKYYDDNKTTFADKTLDQVKSQISDQLSQNKLSTEFQTWMQDLRGKSKIIYFANFK
jgi:foldase protein PrsA